MDQKIQEILSELQKLRSIDFNGYRTAMLKRRIKSRMTSLNIDDMDEYIKVLKSTCEDPPFIPPLIRGMPKAGGITKTLVMKGSATKKR